MITMFNNKFIFRNRRTHYNYNWIDNNTFTFCFGDGEFVDKMGNDYFVLVEYHADENAFRFEIWYEYEVIPADEFYITESEKADIIQFMNRLMDNIFISMLAIV